MRYWIGAVLALLMLASNTAQPAESQSRASKMFDEISSLQKNLYAARRDFLEMAQGSLGTREFQGISEILAAVSDADAVADKYALVTEIYSVMLNDSDKTIVLKRLHMMHGSIGKRLDIAITQLNLGLPSLRTPALISQAERIRDNIRQLQAKMQSWSP